MEKIIEQLDGKYSDMTPLDRLGKPQCAQQHQEWVNDENIACLGWRPGKVWAKVKSEQFGDGLLTAVRH